MKFTDIKTKLVEILEEEGKFISAYQICQKLETNFPDIWKSLLKEYLSKSPETPMGKGTGVHYSPANFVANALSKFLKDSGIKGLIQESFSCAGVSFNGIEPGYTGNTVGIWAIRR